jgi:hypothetical protein
MYEGNPTLHGTIINIFRCYIEDELRNKTK